MTQGYRVYDTRQCALGEGRLWHPVRQQLFWFDILGKRLLGGGGAEWRFDQHVSAAGWIDHDHLLIASETALLRFNLATQTSEVLAELESDNSQTRSNDGRADPMGGFWIGTMGKAAQPGQGAIYRYYRGELRKLHDQITISNAICFAPDGHTAYFTDTPTQKIMAQSLDPAGWPSGAPRVLIDLSGADLNPDGAVVDADGCLWVAQWGASRVARYSAEGAFLSAHLLPASQITCPAFGPGQIYVTSAAEGVAEPQAGQTFSIETDVVGQLEHQVIL